MTVKEIASGRVGLHFDTHFRVWNFEVDKKNVLNLSYTSDLLKKFVLYDE